MPATSPKQQRFMALVHMVQTGRVKKSTVSEDIKDAAKSMSEKQSAEFMHLKKADSSVIVDDSAEKDAQQLQAISDTLKAGGKIEATPDIIALLRRRQRRDLPAFPNMLKALETDGVLEYNPQYVRQLKYAGKRAVGWKPNEGLVWMNKHPDTMRTLEIGATGALFGAGLTGIASSSSPLQRLAEMAAGAIGGGLGAVGGAELFRALHHKRAADPRKDQSP